MKHASESRSGRVAPFWEVSGEDGIGLREVREPFSTSRLTLARERRGMLQKQLADQCGLSKGAISQYESGETTPSISVVQRFSLALNFPQQWFYAPELELLASSAPSFRSRRKLTASARLKSVRSGDIAASVLLADFKQKFRLPAIDVPDLSHLAPQEAAAQLRRLWKLGEGPVPQIVPLMESRGIFVFYTLEENDALDAWSVWQGAQPLVMLNLLKTDGERERFDGCHEIGHAVLHRKLKKDVLLESRECEDEVNLFASSFLIPENMFRIECPRTPDLMAFLRMKARWGVSVKALVYRAQSLGLLSKYHAEIAFKEMAKRNWSKGEPNSIKRSDSKIHRYIADHLSSTGITAEQYAANLLLPYDQLTELLPVFGKMAVSSSKIPTTEPPRPALTMI